MTASPSDATVDLVTLGQRLRHQRRAKGLTLDQLSAAVGRAPSQLSLIENGKREPKLSVLRSEWIRAFLQRYYEYEPQITPEEVETRLGMSPAFRWDKRGQWIQIYTK